MFFERQKKTIGLGSKTDEVKNVLGNIKEELLNIWGNVEVRKLYFFLNKKVRVTVFVVDGKVIGWYNIPNSLLDLDASNRLLDLLPFSKVMEQIIHISNELGKLPNEIIPNYSSCKFTFYCLWENKGVCISKDITVEPLNFKKVI